MLYEWRPSSDERKIRRDSRSSYARLDGTENSSIRAEKVYLRERTADDISMAENANFCRMKAHKSIPEGYHSQMKCEQGQI